MTRLYFAYGSNLNVRQMATRCPTARLLGPARLPEHRLVFRGVADVERAQRSSAVPGALWEIQPADLEALDRYEGYPTLYTRELADIRDAKGRRRRAIVYRMRHQERRGLPSPGYLDSILQGYRDVGIQRQAGPVKRALRDAAHDLLDQGITALVPNGKRMAPARERRAPVIPIRRTAGMTRATQLELEL